MMNSAVAVVAASGALMYASHAFAQVQLDLSDDNAGDIQLVAKATSPAAAESLYRPTTFGTFIDSVADGINDNVASVSGTYNLSASAFVFDFSLTRTDDEFSNVSASTPVYITFTTGNDPVPYSADGLFSSPDKNGDFALNVQLANLDTSEYAFSTFKSIIGNEEGNSLDRSLDLTIIPDNFDEGSLTGILAPNSTYAFYFQFTSSTQGDLIAGQVATAHLELNFVPEPTGLLFGGTLAGMALLRRRRANV